MDVKQQSEVSIIKVIYAGSERKRGFFKELEDAISAWNESFGRVGCRNVRLQVSSLFENHSDRSGSKIPRSLSSHVVIHKLTDEMAQCKQRGASEPVWSRLFALFEALQHTRIQLDSIPGVCCILDRMQMTEIIDKTVRIVRRDKQFNIRSPKWQAVSILDDDMTINKKLSILKYPIIFKHRTASGTPNSHDMVISYDTTSAFAVVKSILKGHKTLHTGQKFLSSDSTFQKQDTFDVEKKEKCSSYESAEGCIADASDITCLAHIRRYVSSDIEESFLGSEKSMNEYLAQEYVSNHGGVLFKVYVIGDHIDVQVRSSVIHGHDKCKHGFFYFNSQKVGCKDSAEAEFDSKTGFSKETNAQKPSHNLVEALVNGIKKELNLTMFGVDMVYDVEEDCFVIIDINYMPGYKGVINAHARMVDLIVNRVRDSGLLDEKKDE